MSVDLSKEIVVFPLLSFYFFFLLFLFFYFLWPHWLFLFISHMSSLGYFVCPLWDILFVLFGIFYLSSLGSFPHFKGNTLYFTRSIGDHHTLQEVLNIKKTENYHDVCKCMPLPV